MIPAWEHTEGLSLNRLVPGRLNLLPYKLTILHKLVVLYIWKGGY